MTKEEIKQIRKSLSLTQQQFVDALNPSYNRVYFNLVENGKRKVGKKLIKAIRDLEHKDI